MDQQKEPGFVKVATKCFQKCIKKNTHLTQASEWARRLCLPTVGEFLKLHFSFTTKGWGCCYFAQCNWSCSDVIKVKVFSSLLALLQIQPKTPVHLFPSLKSGMLNWIHNVSFYSFRINTLHQSFIITFKQLRRCHSTSNNAGGSTLAALEPPPRFSFQILKIENFTLDGASRTCTKVLDNFTSAPEEYFRFQG